MKLFYFSLSIRKNKINKLWKIFLFIKNYKKTKYNNEISEKTKQ